MSPEEAYQFIDTFDSKETIYNVLRNVGVAPTDSEFENCAQGAWVAFYLWLLEADTVMLDDATLRKTAYLRMFRQVLNILYTRNGSLAIHADNGSSLADVPEVEVGMLTVEERSFVWHLVGCSGNVMWLAEKSQLSQQLVVREVKALIRSGNDIRGMLQHREAGFN